MNIWIYQCHLNMHCRVLQDQLRQTECERWISGEMNELLLTEEQAGDNDQQVHVYILNDILLLKRY